MGPVGTSFWSRRFSIRQRGLVGNTHGGLSGTAGEGTLNRKRPEKPEVRGKKSGRPARPSASTEIVLWTCAAVKVRRISPFLKAASPLSLIERVLKSN